MRSCALVLALALAPLGIVTAVEAQPRVSVQTDKVEFRDIVLGAPETGAVRIGLIALTGFKSDASRITATRAEFTDIAFTAGTSRTAVPALVVTDLSLPPALFEAITKSGSPTVDWAALFAQSTAAEIAFARAGMRDSGSNASADYTDLSIKGIAGGIAQSVRLALMASTAQDPTGAQVSATVKDTVYDKVDFAEVVRYFTGGGRGDKKVLIASGSSGAFKMTMPGVTVEAAKAEMGAFHGRAPAAAMPLAAVHALQGSIPSGQTPQQLPQLIAYYREALQYLQLDRYALRDLKIATPAGPVEIGDITMENFSGGGLGRFAVNGVRVATPGGPARLGAFEILGINWKKALDLAFNAGEKGTEPDLDDILPNIPSLAALRFAGLDAASPIGPVTFDEVRFEMPAGSAGWVDSVSAIIRGLKVDVSKLPSGGPADPVKALGYQTVTGNAQVKLRHLAGERAIVLEVPTIEISEVGRIELTAKFAGVNLPADPSSVDDAAFDSLTLRLTDNGLGNRAFGVFARTAGVSPEAIRAAVAAEMKSQAQRMFGAALAPGSAEAIEEFLRTGQTVVLTARPRPGANPPTFAEMQAPPPAYADRLTITIAAEKANPLRNMLDNIRRQ